ncbi:hypothetical protein [Vibrio sp. THAF190c]|uniref:hypothetical protein n=1 Tax=Vibrio sp. THAF190c TaxID=2587865 RepID=UPI0012683A49|nr:hypothetical protein [Vibrio sp. THAF190c]QFT13400.1 hypothetical protein FIV04_25955 [Vibrio sp. THAF190c]
MNRQPSLRKKQKGDLLVNVALGLIVLIVIAVSGARVLRNLKQEQLANIAVNRIMTVQDAAQRHFMESVLSGSAPDSLNNYPLNINELIADGYIDACSDANEVAGLCLNQTKLPWVTAGNADVVLNLVRFSDPADNYPAFRLSFDISNIQPIRFRNVVRSKLIEIPNYTEAGGVVTITFTRPGTAVTMDSLVSRDGSDPMTADWDYGGFYLDNVRDISFTGLTDRTALTGTVKVGSLVTSGATGTSVTKPTCPTDYQPRIEVAVKGITATGSDLPYNLKAVAAWAVDNGVDWLVRYRATGEDVDGVKTYFDDGAVTYFTWCDFI